MDTSCWDSRHVVVSRWQTNKAYRPPNLVGPLMGDGEGVVYYYVGIFNYDDGIIVSYAGTVSCPYQVYPLFFFLFLTPFISSYQ